MSNVPLKARISLKDGGPLSASGRGRSMKRGEVHTITSVSDVIYYMNTGLHDVAIIQGALPAEFMDPADSVDSDAPPDSGEQQEDTEEQPDDSDEGEGEGEPDDEQEGGDPAEPDTSDEGEGAPESGEPDDEQEGEPEAVKPLEAYDRAALELMSKSKLIVKAADDGLNVDVKSSMPKSAIIDAMIAANPANQQT